MGFSESGLIIVNTAALITAVSCFYVACGIIFSDRRKRVDVLYALLLISFGMWAFSTLLLNLGIINDDGPFSVLLSISWAPGGFLFFWFVYEFERIRKNLFFYLITVVLVVYLAVLLFTPYIVCGITFTEFGAVSERGPYFLEWVFAGTVFPFLSALFMLVFNILFRNSRKTNPNAVKIILIFFFASILGMVTDFLGPVFFGADKMPQMGFLFGAFLAGFSSILVAAKKTILPHISDISTDIFLLSQDGLIICDEDRGLIDINPSARQILENAGIELSDFTENHDDHRVFYETSDSCDRNIKVEKRDYRFMGEITGRLFILKKNRKKTFSDKDSRDRLELEYKMSRDKLEKIYGSLHRVEERYRALFENRTEAIIVCELPDGRITSVNTAACMIFGFSQKTFKEICFFDLFAEKEKFSDILPDVSEDGKSFEKVFFRSRSRDCVPVKMFSFLKRGERDILISVLHDISHIEEIKKAYVRSARLSGVSIIAGAIAHQFNNYHSVIRGYLDIMIKRFQMTDEIMSMMKKMIRSVNRATQITKDISFFSDAGHKYEDEVDIRTMINVTVKLFDKQIQSHGIDLTEKFDEEFEVKGNLSQLAHCFVCILRNAVEAVLSSDVRKISIHVLRGKKGPVIQVRDSGPGIDRDVGDKIFRPFYTTKSKPGSADDLSEHAGLGLSVVYLIMSNHGGRVRYYEDDGYTVFEMIFQD